MKPFIRKRLPYILIAVQVILIMGLLFYIVPGRYRLYDIVLYDASENVPANPLTGYAPRAELEEDCEGADLVFIMLPFSEWEPQEGVFDREGVKEKYHIEEHRQAGRHAVLRFVCDLPSKHSHRDVPDWLCSISRGVDYKDASGKGYAPDYGDETFLKAHQEALDALAAWCAEDSFVSYVEIGSVGQNGDWSATAESAADLIPSGQVLEQYRQQYEEAFSGDEDILLLQSGSISAALSDADDAEGTRAAGSWKDVIGDAAATAENLSRTGAVWEKAPVGGGMTDTIPMDTLLMDNLSDTLDQIRRVLVEKCHAEINGEGVDHLAFFTADFLDQEAGTDLIVEQVVLLVACIKLDMSERCEGNGENPSAFLCKQNADDVQFLFDIGGKLVEFFIEIILFVVGICAADHDAVLVLHSVFFTVFIKLKRFHSLYFLYT